MQVDIRETLSNLGITSVYHFTDKANLDTIGKYGIQSLKSILEKGISVKYFGAEELSHHLDKRKGLDRYAHLSFIRDHPMYYIAKRRRTLIDPVWIELDTSILYENSTLFCDKVANANGASLFGIDEVLQRIDFDKLLFEQDFDIRKEARKAEILVHNSIPTKYIKGITYGN